MKHQSNDIDLEKLSSPDALTKPDSTRKDVPLQSVNVGVTRIELLTPKDAFQIFEELGSHHVGVDDSEQTEAKRRKISDGAKSESDTEHQSKSAAETAFASSDSNGSGHELESDEEQNNNDMHSSSDSDLEFGEIPPEPMPLPMDEDGDIDPKLLQRT
ncbi:hypothetical protein IW150_004355 [Coemansia sp. RSA 2607]|nr:hypothetical protein IW150_004355 [Coemansia sp. RSA 2607]